MCKQALYRSLLYGSGEYNRSISGLASFDERNRVGSCSQLCVRVGSAEFGSRGFAKRGISVGPKRFCPVRSKLECPVFRLIGVRYFEVRRGVRRNQGRFLPGPGAAVDMGIQIFGGSDLALLVERPKPVKLER